MTNLTRRNLSSIYNRMDRIFDDFFGGGPAFLRPETGDWDWSPPVDISETGDHVEFRAEVPGLSKEDVSVAVTENVLTLQGEKKQESEVKDETVHRVERAYGRFNRSFTLPKSLRTEQAKASFKDGVLTLSIPKAEQTKPKEIQISVE